MPQHAESQGPRILANESNLYDHVKFLTTLRPFRNSENRDSLERVCLYLNAEWDRYGLEVTEQPFRARGVEYKNVLATYNSEKQRRLIVGAHYDVCGDQPGADDNASAVAGLLETARMVAEAKPELNYRIDFVAFCLEEPPYYATTDMGSFVHASSLQSIKHDIIGLINFEMIGYFHDGVQTYPDPRLGKLYPRKANYIAVIGKQSYHAFNKKVFDLMRAQAAIDVQLADHPMLESLAAMSDQRSFWEFDIPALMICDTSFVRNPHYHTISDDIGTLSFSHMTEVVSCAYRAITGF